MGWVRLQWGGAEPAATPTVNIRWNPQNQRLQQYLHMSTNNTTFVFWNTKQKLEKKLNKNTRLHTIFITSCPGTRRAFIFLSKLHNLSHRGYSPPQHTSLRSQKWKCCWSQNYSKTGTLKKQTKHFLFTTWASQREIAPSWYNLSRRGTSSNMSGLPIPAVMWVVVEVLGVFPSRSTLALSTRTKPSRHRLRLHLVFCCFFKCVPNLSKSLFPVSIQRASERASEKPPKSAAFTKSNNDEKKVNAFKRKSTF